MWKKLSVIAKRKCRDTHAPTVQEEADELVRRRKEQS